MDNYNEDDEVKFIGSLYDRSNEQLKEVYKEQKQNRNDLLKEIAVTMLTYTVADAVMNLSKDEKSKLNRKFLDLITQNTKSQSAATEKVTTQILNNTVNDTFKFYSYNAGLKDVEKIINNNYKGKHFSKRVWDNEKEVAKYLHKQTQEFLQGKVNVNQIKKAIEKTYNNNAYEVRRLVETEVSRCQNEAFDRLCIETDVRKVKYNAVLEACEKCKPLNGNVYEFNKKPDLPKHPLCRCFYEIADGDESSYINKLNENSKDKITEITEESINKIQKLEISGLTKEQSGIIYNEHKSMLKYAMDNNNSKEVSYIFSKGLSSKATDLGEKDMLEFKSHESINILLSSHDIFVMHNHPTNKSFSMYDLQFFITNQNVKYISVAKNNGELEVLIKNEGYDIVNVRNQLFRLIKKNVKTGTNAEYDKVVKKFLEKSDDITFMKG